MKGRKLLKILGLVALLAIVIPFVSLAVPQIVGADYSFVVLSGSMQPTFAAGDVVYVDAASADEVQEGDVITFEPPSGHQHSGAERITHRVVDIVERDDGLYFRTKGDANEEADRALVPDSNIIGTVTFAIPKLGYVIQFAGTDQGIVLLIIVPAVLLIISEVHSLVTAAKAEAESDEEEIQENPSESTASNFEWLE